MTFAEETTLRMLLEIGNYPDKTKGICGHLLTKITQERFPPNFYNDYIYPLLMQDLFDKWPGNTLLGDPQYLVEGSGSAFRQAQINETLWDNPRRLDLLHWMIAELRTRQ